MHSPRPYAAAVLILGIFLCATACFNGEPTFPPEPTIELINQSKTSLTEPCDYTGVGDNDTSFDAGILRVTISFTDGDGDLGDNDEERDNFFFQLDNAGIDTIYITRERLVTIPDTTTADTTDSLQVIRLDTTGNVPATRGVDLPDLSSDNRKPSISGQFTVLIVPVRVNQDNDTTLENQRLFLWLRDRAGNESNRLEVSYTLAPPTCN